jgi:alkanesulfonate monooxygenase SsuD/methylene tetrahydromethanopterin reductase-like flavin-dependent oxidoreductase (luciferase family)
MKVLAFEQLPYRHLPADFTQHYQESVVTTPYNELIDPRLMHEDHVNFLDEMMHAARAGFDGVGVTEHEQASYDILPNPNLQLSALAYNTQKEGLDVALACVGRSLGKSREPLRIAEEYAVLDNISGGRLIAGFPVALSYDANLNNGIPPIETRERFEEARELIVKAWTSKEVFAWNRRFGKYPFVNIWPRPVQKPHPPIWRPGVGSPSTFASILENEHVFVYLSWFGPKYTGSRIFDRYWDMAVQMGKEPNPYRVAFLQVVAVGETDEIAHREYGPHIEHGYNTGLGAIPMGWMGLPGYIDIRGVEGMVKDPGDFGLVPKMRTAKYKELVEAQCALVGSPATVRDQLVDMARKFRIGNFLLMVQMGSMPRELVMKNITLLADKVLPDLKRVWEDENYQHRWWPTGMNGSVA